jgi:hypothetical protein
MFEKRVLRRISGPKRDEITGKLRELHSGSFISCTHHQISLGRSCQRAGGGQGIWHARKRGETCTGFGGKAQRKKIT